jgi:hypothetical protein
MGGKRPFANGRRWYATHSFGIHPSIDDRNLFNPLPPIRMFHLHDLGLGPVKVVGYKRYLLDQLIKRVA